MADTKGERRESARHKARHGMRVTGKYFWIAIANSRVKRDQRRQGKADIAPKDANETTKEQEKP